MHGATQSYSCMPETTTTTPHMVRQQLSHHDLVSQRAFGSVRISMQVNGLVGTLIPRHNDVAVSHSN